jgi:hypothetical protein
MRISEDRYSRDLRRINLARRMIRHEVRTKWICMWTGLSGERVRNLFRSYEASTGGARRHRGPSPKRIVSFLRSPPLRAEVSAIGGLACTLQIVPREPIPNARRTLPSLDTGEWLCHVFELYRHIVPESRLTMDQLILLVITLAEGEDLEIGHCVNCHGALLLDRLGVSRRLCLNCKQDAPRAGLEDDLSAPSDDLPGRPQDSEPPESRQQKLFE